MKKFILLLLLLPVICLSQESAEYMVMENAMITPHPQKVSEFEAGVAAHNKKYHAEGAFGSRIYWISSGKNAGKYMWVMGPLPWSAMDDRPAQAGHDEDWNKNVIAYTLAEGEVTYWKFHPQFSNFPKDFDLKYLSVFMVDFKRFKYPEMIDILEKVTKVNKMKNPDEAYGVYTNEMSDSNDSKDMAFVNFFDSYGWMGQDDTFSKEFDEVHGEGSFAKFLKDVESATNGESSELWIYREDLSGLGANIPSLERQ
ncbi:hypothetical protein [Eudoraea sp.]|uniref:hypothetical protein n=1 Tax=Eudoraea sp. TaxID=1979955 RepID=UPI003C713828